MKEEPDGIPKMAPENKGRGFGSISWAPKEATRLPKMQKCRLPSLSSEAAQGFGMNIWSCF